MVERKVVLVTCAEWPDLSISDRMLADELELRGHSVRALPWNGAAPESFTSTELVVLRSNWDYHHDLDNFDRWLSTIEESPAELRNPAGLVRSFLDKSYIAQLHSDGVRVPRTLVTSDFDLDVAHDWFDEHGFDRVVIKPAWGASGHDVELVSRKALSGYADRWRGLEHRRPMLLQEFMPQVRNGEHSLVFFGGEYSHTLVRRPAADDFRVNGQYGGVMELKSDVDPTLIDFASIVESRLPEPATYARIDVLADGSDHIVMEIEVNEPALGLHLAPGSAARFAQALVG